MLIVAAALDFALAALHVAVIGIGAPAYRFLRAGETIARAAETGARWPARMTAAISALLALWGASALSVAGVLPHVPLARKVVGMIAVVYISRGLALFPQLAGQQVGTDGHPVEPKDLAFSATSLAAGLAHAAGLWTKR